MMGIPILVMGTTIKTPMIRTLTLVIGIETLMMVRWNSGYGYTHRSDGRCKHI